ncbi:MAG: glycosyltransferase family 4 protein [Pseudomonadota bacterium]
MTVLTITARFPSLVQPWLVTQLIEIQRSGGENRLFAGTADTEVIPENVRKYGLDSKCEYISISRIQRLAALLKATLSISGFRAVARGLRRYARVLKSKDLSFGEKMSSLLILQHMGINGISIVHSQSEMMGSRLLPIAIALDVPMVVTFHGLPPEGVRPISARRRRAYTNVADVILLNTEFAKQQYISLGAPAKKITIVPQGLRLDDFPFTERSINNGGPVELLSVGRFHPDKGQRYTIAAIKTLIDQGRNVRLHLVGNGPNRPMLEEYAEDLGLQDFVLFYSRLTDDELRGLYRKVHVFVLASLKSKNQFHEETQGVVLQEAQASGLITIATATGGIPECIDDGRAGFLVNDRSSDELADKIAFVMDHVDQWPQWQEAGREWVETKFSVDVISKKVRAVYLNLVASAGRGH